MSNKMVLIISMFVFVLGVFTVAYYHAVTTYFGQPDGAGTFGDLFGGLNVILTGLVFILTAYSLYRNETLTLENKRASIDQAKVQELTILIAQVEKIHNEFDNGNEISNLLDYINLHVNVIQYKVFSAIPTSFYEGYSEPSFYGEYDNARIKCVTELMPQHFPRYVEYVKLVQYILIRLDEMNSSASSAYATILFTLFSKQEKKALIFYAMYYGYETINDQSVEFIQNLYKRGFLTVEFTEGLVSNEYHTKPVDFMIRAKMRMLNIDGT